MARPIPKTYTLEMYMRKMKDQDIRSDAYVQRMAGQWSNEQINELIYTVLNDNSDQDDGYIPPIILGEDVYSQIWIIDGLQRSSSLMLFRYGNYKITSTMENTFIVYKEKMKKEDGKIAKDEKGNIIWIDVKYNLKGKTYDMLPPELKKIFDEYQIDTVTHRNCTMERISTLIKRYNNHTNMNPAQKAFTYVKNYARNVRDILKNPFFKECYSENDRTKGNLERIVLESVMCMHHLEEWKSGAKQLANYLNSNSSEEEFDNLHSNITRLKNILTYDIKDIFDIKDSFIWLTLFNTFKKYELEDSMFADFLKEFKTTLHSKVVNGVTFDTIDKGRGTKDKSVIKDKLEILELLLCEYLNINIEEIQAEDINILEFVRENVVEGVELDDIEFDKDMLRDWMIGISKGSKINDAANIPSLLSIARYAIKKEYDDNFMESWFTDYELRNKTYILDQKQNYLKMRDDLERYILHKKKVSA